MSNLRRLRCYLLACQAHNFDYTKHLEYLVPSDVAKTLADFPVAIPDEDSVYMGIDSLTMSIRPFDELNQFRTKCFLSFASHQKRNLSLTQASASLHPRLACCWIQVTPALEKQVLKLYVAAYQYKPIWKKLWTTVYPVISPQIIRDVEEFVKITPFAAESFVEILKTSSPFVQ